MSYSNNFKRQPNEEFLKLKHKTGIQKNARDNDEESRDSGVGVSGQRVHGSTAVEIKPQCELSFA
jgi:hypothetical protein